MRYFSIHCVNPFSKTLHGFNVFPATGNRCSRINFLSLICGLAFSAVSIKALAFIDLHAKSISHTAHHIQANSLYTQDGTAFSKLETSTLEWDCPVAHSNSLPITTLASCSAPEIYLFSGESRVLPIPNVQRIAIGNGRLINASVINQQEVLVFANHPGMTTISVWYERPSKDLSKQPPQQIKVYVLPSETLRTQRDVAAFISNINGAHARMIGDKVIIEGENLTDSNQEKISEIAKRYPQVINFTNRISLEKMILIDVQVVEFPTTALRQLGVQWQGSTQGGIDAGINWHTQAALRSSPFAFLGVTALLQSQILLLAQKGEAAILAQPRLSTRNGSTALFFAGGEIPYQVSEERDRRSVIFKPYGVKLEIQPRVDHRGIIRANIETEVSSIDASLETQSGPALRTRKTKAEFNLRDGQTMILSGFLNREQIRHQQKLPGLGDLPILGALFRSEKFQQRETELVVFVTPHIADPESNDAAVLNQTIQNLEKQLGPSPSNLSISPHPFTLPSTLAPELP